MDALLRRRAMIAAGGGTPPTPPPPPPPVEIPYIRNTNLTEYIDTGITPDNTTKVIVWARNFNPNSLFLFGSRNAYKDAAFGIMSANATAVGALRNNYGNSTGDVNDSFTLMSGYHKYELDAGKMKVDDVTISTLSSFSGNSNNIHIFGCNNNGARLDPALPIDVCAAQIYKGGVLVRDFTAVNTPSVGLYDAVSGQVFGDANGGTFVYGVFNAAAYTPLEYIECGGMQYFDTLVYGRDDVMILAKFQPKGGAVYSSLLGARTSNSSRRCDFSLGNATDANRYFYFGYQATSNVVYNAQSKTGVDLKWIKDANTSTLYQNTATLGTKTGTAGTFTTDYTMAVGGLNLAGNYEQFFTGYIYFVGFGHLRNYVPALVNNVAGLYDTYNDAFHPSESGTPFVAGTTI